MKTLKLFAAMSMIAGLYMCNNGALCSEYQNSYRSENAVQRNDLQYYRNTFASLNTAVEANKAEDANLTYNQKYDKYSNYKIELSKTYADLLFNGIESEEKSKLLSEIKKYEEALTYYMINDISYDQVLENFGMH
ncbi:MAG: hypothetical protein IJU54_00350 [Alphaproteobacteria bacterium]|nr:hypothetical protein [Alphaproteobacteria bacterium]